MGFLLGGLVVSQLACLTASAAPDPSEQLTTFSAFESVDLGRLLSGEILGEPGSPMKFGTGISAETCFVVSVPAPETARRLQIWDPSLRGTLKTVEFHSVSNVCTAADFRALSLKPESRSQRWLLEQSAASLGRNSDLNLTREEARQLGQAVKTQPTPSNISASWAGILLARARLFQSQGFSGILPYELTGQPVQPAIQLRAMLRERPAVASEFARLLQQCGVFGEKGAGKLEPFYYWAIYEANRRATLTLGAVYLLPVADQFQLLDVEYYVSGNYYTFVTLYNVWPLPAGEKSLVWRGDFFSAPTLAYTRGVERLAYGAFMLQELKKTIRSFQTEALKPDFQPGATAR